MVIGRGGRHHGRVTPTRSLLGAAAATAALAFAPAAASANATVSYLGGTATITSVADESNRITVSTSGNVLRVAEASTTVAGLDNGSPPMCAKPSPKVVQCDTTSFGLASVRANLGPGNDRLDAPDFTVPVTANGEAGGDVLTGGTAADALSGGAGADTLNGAAGADTLGGGADNDVLVAGAGDDRFDGGDGIDTVDYASALVPVTVVLGPGGAETSKNGQAESAGSPAENDAIEAVENAAGGAAADRLTGNELANFLDGRGNADALDGAGGSDTLRGGLSNDTLTGGPGNDALDGGTGGDALDGGEGGDGVAAGAGNDLVTSRDGVAESGLDCGEGTGDRLIGDNGSDATAGCEFVAPQTIAPASLSGNPVEGETLTLNPPVVTGGPFAVDKHELHRCTADESKCVLVVVGDSYKLRQIDVGKILFARVTVSNAAGRVVEESPRTPPITDVPGTSGGSKPGGGTAPPPVFARGPAAELTKLAKPKLLRRGTSLRLRVGRRIACRAILRSCGVDVKATAKLKRKTTGRARQTRLGYTRLVLTSGTSLDVSALKLKRKVAKRLRPGRKVKITLKITVTQAGSDDVVEKLKLKLKVPKKR